MPRNTAIAWVVALLAFWTVPVGATAVQFSLAPGPVRLGFRAYGLGLLRIDGQFTRFVGTLTLDDADPGACSVALHAEAASLQMPQRGMTEDALGPDLMDVGHFPDFGIDGHCDGARLQGTLLLHGIVRPILLDVSSGGGRWQVNGLIRRADWGMGARPWLAGPEVQVSIVAGLPPGFPPATERGLPSRVGKAQPD